MHIARLWITAVLVLIRIISCLVQNGIVENAAQETSGAALSPASLFAQKGFWIHEIHCYGTNAGRSFGVIDMRACNATINLLKRSTKTILLETDYGIKAAYELQGVNCAIEIYGGSEEVRVSERLLSRVASDVVHNTCKELGKGGVASFGDDDYFLSIQSRPLGLGTTTPNITRDQIPAALVADLDVSQKAKCHGEGYVKLNQQACQKLLEEVMKDRRPRILRPRLRKIWEEGLGECDIVLTGGTAEDYISPRDVVETALAIRRACAVFGRGGQAPIGQKGATVEIYTILRGGPSQLVGDVEDGYSNTSVPQVRSRPGYGNELETIQCYTQYGRVQREACDRVLRKLDRQPQLVTYQPNQNIQLGDQGCELWIFQGSRPIQIWSNVIMRKAREILVRCSSDGHGGVGHLGLGGFQVAIRSPSVTLQSTPPNPDMAGISSSGALDLPTSAMKPRSLEARADLDVRCTQNFHRKSSGDDECTKLCERLHRRRELGLHPRKQQNYGFGICRMEVEPRKGTVRVSAPTATQEGLSILRRCSGLRERGVAHGQGSKGTVMEGRQRKDVTGIYTEGESVGALPHRDSDHHFRKSIPVRSFSGNKRISGMSPLPMRLPSSAEDRGSDDPDELSIRCHRYRDMLDENDCIMMFARLQHADSAAPLRPPGSRTPFRIGQGSCRATIRAYRGGMEVQLADVGKQVERIMRYCSLRGHGAGQGGFLSLTGYGVDVHTSDDDDALMEGGLRGRRAMDLDLARLAL